MSKKMPIAVAAVALLSWVISPATPAFAQGKFQSPDGRQTIAPSDMPQQPTLNEEFSRRAKGNTIPEPTGPDWGGVHNINLGSSGNSPDKSGAVPQGPIQEHRNQPQNQQTKAPNLPNEAPTTAPGGPSSPGALVLPQGEPSTVRTGPIEPVPVWTRVILAIWVLFMAGVTTVVAIALTAVKNREIDELGGHLIRPDYQEPREAIDPRYLDRPAA
jgi:hypothetical protein